MKMPLSASVRKRFTAISTLAKACEMICGGICPRTEWRAARDAPEDADADADAENLNSIAMSASYFALIVSLIDVNSDTDRLT